MDWNDAMRMAEQRTDGARLPTRNESALLYAHLRESFDRSSWHWTSTRASGGAAWNQGFDDGYQDSDDLSFEARVRLVRRFAL